MGRGMKKRYGILVSAPNGVHSMFYFKFKQFNAMPDTDSSNRLDVTKRLQEADSLNGEKGKAFAFSKASEVDVDNFNGTGRGFPRITNGLEKIL